MASAVRVHNTTAVDRVGEDARRSMDCLALGLHDPFENSTGYLPELRFPKPRLAWRARASTV
jgi:hypothetical protein